MNAKRVLVFAPYASWHVHSNYETTLAVACRLRGADVRSVLCDGVLAECDMFGAAMSDAGKPRDLCARCQAGAREALAGTGLEPSWLSSYVTPEERGAIFSWAQSLPPADLAAATYAGRPVGKWAWPSVISYFRTYPARLDDWETVNVARGFLQAVAFACVGLSRLLSELRPDAVILFNARLSVLFVAFQLARERGARVLVHERPRTEATIAAIENAVCTSPTPFHEFWRAWRDVPLVRSELDRALRWLVERRTGADRHALVLAGAGSGKDVRTALGLSQKKLVAIFTTSTDEYAADDSIRWPFPSQEEWIDRVARWIGTRDDACLVVRTHPSLSGSKGTGFAKTQIAWFQELARRAPANVRVVLPDAALSSYDLMAAADLGLSYGSTAGLEMLSLGKPVGVVPGIAIYEDVPGVIRLEDPARLEEQLAHALSLEPSRENIRAALRVVHRSAFDSQLPFSLVSMTGPFTSRKEYRDESALALGKDATLDRVCDFLLEGKPTLRAPSPEERARSRDEEDRFLDALAEETRRLEREARRRAAIHALQASARKLARSVLPAPVRRSLRAVEKHLRKS